MKEIVADLTPYLTGENKTSDDVIGAYITVDEENEEKAIEIKFRPELSQMERNGIIIFIGDSLLSTCAATEAQNPNDEFLRLMDGIQIKEWIE